MNTQSPDTFTELKHRLFTWRKGMKKYALLIAISFFLVGSANAEKMSDRMITAMAEIHEEAVKCAAIYTMSFMSFEKAGTDVEEIKKYKEKAAENLYIAKTFGALAGKNEEETMEGILDYQPIFSRLIQSDDNERIKTIFMRCFMMSNDYRGFIKSKLRAVGIPAELIETMDW